MAKAMDALEKKLASRDAQIAEMQTMMKQMQLELAKVKASPNGAAAGGALRAVGSFGSMPKGLPPGAVPQTERERPVSPGRAGIRPASARAASPGRAAGRTSPGRSSSPKRSASPGSFHASMRGGPLTEPLQWKGLTDQERKNPYNSIRGPSLLTRERFGAKKSEWETYSAAGASPIKNLLMDDNPFNDPIKYHPFRGWAFPPSSYVGPDDERETDDMSRLSGSNALKLGFAFGYCGRRARQNLFYNADSRIVYHVAALGIVYDKDRHEQNFFCGHDDDITALDMHPDKVRFVTGQVGKIPKILVWSSRPDASGVLQQLCLIQGDHRRGIIGLSFSSNGSYIASMGRDNDRCIAVYRWGKDKTLEQMRIGIDKGHNDEVYALDYNPVTDHVVAVGKKYIRFFGVKEGVEEKMSAERTAKLSATESPIWAKKGVFGKWPQEDMMCVAFDAEGVTYAGTATGYIYRFGEQAMDVAVLAHGGGDKDRCKVTALWYSKIRQELLSSGDDGMLKVWRPKEWNGKSAPQPVRVVDLDRWVNAGAAEPALRGMPIVPDSLADTKGPPKLGKGSAAHSIYGDERGNVLVGTVCNEIYELSLESAEPPMCYMQGHYEELWGLAAHPTKAEFATAGEDCTVRVWELATKTMKTMARLPGPGRSVAYSPNGKFIAVGLGAGGKAKGKASEHEGRWMLFTEEDLSPLSEDQQPPKLLNERVADIKWSPDGKNIAIASADNFIDVYQIASSGRSVDYKGRLKGHSSYVRRLDWSADSCCLQSCCGAYEVLYWRLRNADGSWKPRQEKSSSKMRDEVWATHSVIFGWPVRGIWPQDSDGTDINAVARSIKYTEKEGLIATADDWGKVKIFKYPCIVPHAAHVAYGGHSSHVTNLAFTSDNASLLSAGGNDRAVLLWRVVRT